jgi:hypothetical protein
MRYGDVDVDMWLREDGTVPGMQLAGRSFPLGVRGDGFAFFLLVLLQKKIILREENVRNDRGRRNY